MWGEFRTATILAALIVLVIDWAGFLWGTSHTELAFALAQIGFFIVAHALYTTRRK